MSEKSILLVDDDIQFRNLVVPILKEHNYRVVQTSNGVQSLQALQFDKFDVAIVDGRLPDTDGLALIEKLRKHSKDMKLVYVSAYWRDAASYARMTKDFQVSLILHKPVMPLVFGLQIDGLFVAPQGEMPNAKQLQIARNLQAMTMEYKKTMPDAVGELKGLCRQAQEKREDTARMEAAITAAHKIRGTAGTFGLPEFGLLMGTIEDSLREIAAEKVGSFRAEGIWGGLNLNLLKAANSVERFRTESAELVNDTPTRSNVLYVAPTAVSVPPAPDARVEFIIAQDCGDATALLQDEIRAMIVDIAPGQSAATLNFLQRFRDTKPPVPVLLLPAPGEQIDKGHCLYLGAEICTTRPSDAAALSSLARELVDANKRPKWTILLVDDDANFLKQASTMLEHDEVIIATCKDSITALDMLERLVPDVLLLDVDLPGLSGFDLCKTLRTKPEFARLPVIFVTVRTGWESRVTAYQVGASDFITKPVLDAELRARVRNWIDRLTVQNKLSTHDGLTGLSTHGQFVAAAQTAHEELSGNGLLMPLALIDISDMQLINQEHGSAAGDAMLAELGELMNKRFSTRELRGRIDGQRFAIAFAGHDRATATSALDRFVAEFEARQFSGAGDKKFRVKCRKALVECAVSDSSLYASLARAAHLLGSASQRT